MNQENIDWKQFAAAVTELAHIPGRIYLIAAPGLIQYQIRLLFGLYVEQGGVKTDCA
jgi:hypothetical protein